MICGEPHTAFEGLCNDVASSGWMQNSLFRYSVLPPENPYMFPCRWETGYWGTMDIAHDRAGYYLCWGCLNWVPAIYTSPALYLVEKPIQWSTPAAIAIAMAGTLAIYINYDSDRQRQVCAVHLSE